MEDVIHVAYADDHTVVRKSLITELKMQRGVSIDIEASDGKELLEKLSTAQNLPSVCLVDISMPPGMNGFDTTVEIKKRWPQVGVLILSQHDYEHYIIRMIQHGASGYLLKTTEPRELKDAITTIHNGGFYYSELVPKKWSEAVKQNLIKAVELTEMEKLVLKYSCSDLSYAEIALQLKTTKRGVEGHRDNLFRKLDVHSRVGLALYAVQFGYALLGEILPDKKKYIGS